MAALPPAPHDAIPTRTGTNATRTSTGLTDDGAIPGEDTSETTRLFQERLQAWKHACGYIEDYVVATEKLHHSHGKEYERVLKTVTHPLKEGHHFDQSLGGVAGFFDNVRSNTQGISNSHYETAKALKGSVLPTFERLHSEIKNKSKELTKGAGKGSKAVDKARNATQKHIELLGQHTASYDSTGGKIAASDDPYILQRGVTHRLNKQVQEENSNRQDLLAVQSNFASFEAHIIQTIQQGLGQFNGVISKQAEVTRGMYGDMTGTVQRIPADFEWNGFVKRNTGVLIDPEAPPRDIQNISFPNQGHRATTPLISGSLDRRGKILRKYDTKYYVVSPSKFLHEFSTDDDFAKDPTPDLSLYLPDCAVGAIDGEKFTVKGKDASKGKLGVSMTHDYNFKAHTIDDAFKWWEIIRGTAGQVTNEIPEASAPTSPVTTHTAEGEKFGTLPATQSAGSAAAAAPHAHNEKAAGAAGPAATQHTGQPAPAYTETAAPHTGTAAPATGGTGLASTMEAQHGTAPATAAPATAAPAAAPAAVSAPGATSAGPKEGVVHH